MSKPFYLPQTITYESSCQREELDFPEDTEITKQGTFMHLSGTESLRRGSLPWKLGHVHLRTGAPTLDIQAFSGSFAVLIIIRSDGQAQMSCALLCLTVSSQLWVSAQQRRPNNITLINRRGRSAWHALGPIVSVVHRAFVFQKRKYIHVHVL